jgi:hypothetical protein
MEKKFTLQQILAFTGGLLGLLAGLVIGLRRFGVYILFPDPAFGSQPQSGDALAGQIAFLLVFTLPFVLSLIVLRSRRVSLQAVVWIGAGLLALVGTIASFSAITRVLLPLPGILLLIGGGMAFTRPEVKRAVLVIAMALVLVVAGGASFLNLFTEENPVCWSLVRNETGADVWVRNPQGVVPLSAPAAPVDPDVPVEPGLGDITSYSCVSDVINLREAWTGLGIWAAALAGLFVLSRRSEFE